MISAGSFFLLGGAHQLLASVAQAAAFLSPVSTTLPAATFLADPAGIAQLLLQSAHVMLKAVSLAAPVLICLLLFDLLAAVASRCLGKANVLFDILALKVVLGLALVSLAIAAAPEAYRSAVLGMR